MGIQDLIVNARAALSGDQSVRIVIAAAVVFFVVVCIACLVMILRAVSPRGRLEALLESQAAIKRTPQWTMRIVGVLLLAGALFGTRSYLASPATCAQCHVKSAEAAALSDTPHKKVACGDCHGGSGPTGGLRLGVSYIRWTSGWMVGGQIPKKMSATVESLACLGCHRDIGPTRVSAGIRVRHSDFLDTGARCDQCHAGVAHPGVKTDAAKPDMNECLPCHDGTHAPSKCETCHVKDLAQEAASRRPRARIEISRRSGDCYACHDQKPCLRCHGVSMPHPAGWSPAQRGVTGAGQHAREAFLHRERCFRCHFGNGSPGKPTAQACSCHHYQTTGGMHGGKAWIAEHGLEATGKKPGDLAECFMCHGTQLCSYCHTSGYENKYKPVVGYDNYIPDTPKPKYDF